LYRIDGPIDSPKRKGVVDVGRYLVLWENDFGRYPTDPQERVKLGKGLTQAVLQGIETGLIKEWGIVVGEHRGFGVYEGSETEVGAFLEQFIPWPRSTVNPVLSATELDAMLDAMLQ
jgi:hypothetical protein